MAEYEVIKPYMIEDKIAKGEELLAMMQSRATYLPCPYRIKVAKSRAEMPEGDDLWVMDPETGNILNKEPWVVQLLEEYDLDSEEGAKIQALGAELY